MTPISVPPTSSSSAGFTLIELLAVLAIMGIVAYGAAGMIGRKPEAAERAHLELKLKAALQAARQDALQHGRTVQLDLTAIAPSARQFNYRPALGSNDTGVVFYADGSSSGGEVLLDGEALLVIDWLTGEADNAPRPG
jgi:prepilin-type N-terminal cleavage/methylation domain-containing protein